MSCQPAEVARVDSHRPAPELTEGRLVSYSVPLGVREMRVLFVDDEVNTLQGLQRMLRHKRHEWHLCFAESGESALGMLENEAFDVVVSDVRMPVMDGVELLETVKHRYPGVVRIILSGHCAEGAILRAVGPAHQYLSKPCDTGVLIAAIHRSAALRATLGNRELRNAISRMASLPSLPSLYKELVNELRSEEPSIQRIGEIVSKDVAMSAKVLQLVNSAFFGLSQPMSDSSKAVMHLGTDTIRNLALSTEVFARMEGTGACGVDLERTWNHCMTTAILAKEIALQEGAGRDVVDAAYQAGFLHDIGKVVLATNLPDEYSGVGLIAAQKGIREWEAEVELLGSTHAHVGGYLLGIWGLPDQVVEAVAFHHSPRDFPATEFCPLTAVHVADALERELVADDVGAVSGIDRDHLSASGVAGRLSAWTEAARLKLGQSGCR